MNKHTLIMEQPATRWEDATPCGNGEVGAMMYGSLYKERILLNHENLWLPLYRDPKLPDMAKYLAKYRKLLMELKFQEADKFYCSMLRKEGWPSCLYTNPFQPACDLVLETRVDKAFTEYRRTLDFCTGEAAVEWQQDDISFRRTLFVSRADGVVVVRTTASEKGAVDIVAGLAEHPFKDDVRKCLHFPQSFTRDQIPLTLSPSASAGWLRIDGKYDNGKGYGAVAKVIAKGASVRTGDTSVTVRGATEVVVILALTNEKLTPGVTATLKKRVNAATALGYTKLLARHAKVHGELYGRVALDLSGSDLDKATTSQLLSLSYGSPTPNAMVEKLFNYGRYLFVSSTGTKGLPPNLQGIWNGEYVPAWSSDYTLDENIQMAHWAVLPGNLAELHTPYFDYLESTMKAWRANAKQFFGCRGVYTCLRQSTSGLMAENMPYMIWADGAGWLGRQYWDYWLFTGDRAFLRDRAVPFLKEVALFYEDFLFEGKDGKYILCPSMSPENIPDIPGGTRPTVSPTMGIAVCKEVLTSLCEACETLGIEKKNTAKWQAMLAKLPAYQINKDGALREWLYPGLKDNYHHRHLSHIYPLFPGNEVTKEKTPELYEGCRVAVEKRLVVGIKEQTGWSLAHMAHIYARLGQGERALECFDILTRSCVGPNLLMYHNDYRHMGVTDYFGSMPPYQIDANLGFTSAIIEMLAFSVPGMVKLLPALPKRWKSGSIQNIRCRGGIALSLSWNTTRRTLSATLRSEHSQKVTIAFPSWMKSVKASGARAPEASSYGKLHREVKLPAKKAVVLTFS